MDKADVYQKTLKHFLEPIWTLMEDEAVSEVLINGPDTIYAERGGKLTLTGREFPDNAALMSAVRNISEFVDRRVDEDNHSMDARLPDGSRVHVIIPPCSRGGAHISIRRFKKSTFNLQSLIDWGSLTEMSAEFLGLCVVLHKNTIISGGTGTGKTSMLNALSTEIPEHERIIVIEDSSELQLNQPHTVYLEAQQPRPNGRGEVTIRDLFVDSLRMRPDRIVMGEIRRGEGTGPDSIHDLGSCRLVDNGPCQHTAGFFDPFGDVVFDGRNGKFLSTLFAARWHRRSMWSCNWRD